MRTKDCYQREVLDQSGIAFDASVVFIFVNMPMRFHRLEKHVDEPVGQDLSRAVPGSLCDFLNRSALTGIQIEERDCRDTGRDVVELGVHFGEAPSTGL